MERELLDKRHKQLMLPVVRIRTGSAIGSGTVIYSREKEDGEASTYVLTNFHVIEGLIQVKDQWSALLQRNVKKDVRGIADTDFFEYRWLSRAVGATTIQTDIIAYDREEDLALLRLRSGRSIPSVAKLYPREQESQLRVTMPVYCVGAGLGNYPVITEGMLSQFGIEIDNREFWASTAPGIYGNSGGALFLDGEDYQLIGVPARIAVTWGTPITHLMYAIPITRIYSFLESQRYRFIYDSEFTEEGEEKERERMRESDEKNRPAEAEESKPKDVKGFGNE